MHQVGDQTKVILRCTVNQPSRFKMSFVSYAGASARKTATTVHHESQSAPQLVLMWCGKDSSHSHLFKIINFWTLSSNQCLKIQKLRNCVVYGIETWPCSGKKVQRHLLRWAHHRGIVHLQANHPTYTWSLHRLSYPTSHIDCNVQIECLHIFVSQLIYSIYSYVQNININMLYKRC